MRPGHVQRGVPFHFTAGSRRQGGGRATGSGAEHVHGGDGPYASRVGDYGSISNSAQVFLPADPHATVLEPDFPLTAEVLRRFDFDEEARSATHSSSSSAESCGRAPEVRLEGR